jgi:hypothetical protein
MINTIPLTCGCLLAAAEIAFHRQVDRSLRRQIA